MKIIEDTAVIEILKKEFINLHDLLPSEFQDDFNKYAFISGGCIYSLHNDKEPKDFDFFVIDKEYSNKLLSYFKNQDIKPFKNLLQGKYKDLHLMISKYAISIGKYQIVVKYVGDIKSVVDQFDFRHNQYAYYDNQIHNFSGGDYINSNELSFNDERARDICGCILRLPKFIKRGMTISKKETAKMLSKLKDNGFDDAEIEILKDYTTY